ncbi:unnamed protein product [Paramecium octaurelia]|uniref:Uncharacterized protein n=1 Tax=Paramecium octaurelia TaxID=43137 RepID=A0A8S1XML6_PAROT|nr:unnamed protein product [Paramecium octaurelia]
MFQEIICKSHNLEFIAVDLDMSDKSQIKMFCSQFLVDKLNNKQITTYEQSKERIQQLKTQQQQIKIKENQGRLNYYNNILNQIVDFKRSIDDSLEKMYKQIWQNIFQIQNDKKELQENQQQFNYFEDIKQLSELSSSDRYKSTKLIEDNTFIDDLTRQFEQLFNNDEYFQTLDTFKNTKQIIQYKTPCISRICVNHKKEVIMIDMDSQKKKIEDRFVCVDCVFENPLIKQQTIENVNKLWIDYSSGDQLQLIEINNTLEIENNFINQLVESNLFNQISMYSDEKQQEQQKELKQQQNRNQNEIEELNAKFSSQEQENQNFIELFNQNTQEITNLKKQNEEDKLRIIKTLEDQKNKQIEEMTKGFNQQESEYQLVQRQLLQINQEKSNKILKLYYFLILIWVQVVNQVKVEKLLTIREVVGQIDFVNKQFQRMVKHCLHSKFSGTYFEVGIGSKILYKNIIIQMQELGTGADHIRYKIMVILTLIITKMLIINNYHSLFQPTRQQQLKQVLKISTSNGLNRIIHQQLFSQKQIHLSIKISTRVFTFYYPKSNYWIIFQIDIGEYNINYTSLFYLNIIQKIDKKQKLRKEIFFILSLKIFYGLKYQIITWSLNQFYALET